MGGHEAAGPGEVLFGEGSPESKSGGLGFRHQQPRGFWQLGE
jgi:hypothetical protein